jgi:uncharacterized protein YegL
VKLAPLLISLAACASSPPWAERELDGSLASEGDAASPVRSLDGAAIRVESDACNQLSLRFEARTPSVVLLVDRSSSMFERGLWEPLQTGVLAVVERLQDDVRFGFVSYTGQAGGSCPDLEQVAPALANHAAIARAYAAQRPPSYKGETPTSLALERVASTLGSQPGDDYILLVTDGEPDLCDDGNVTCARDAVIASAQRAHARGVTTFVLSLGGSVDRAHLRDLANAGTGQPVSDRDDAVRYQCQGQARYAQQDGDAPYYEPDVGDRDALITQLASVLARTRSCVLELGGAVQVQPGDEMRGEVTLDGAALRYGDEYRMNTRTQLELLGDACEQLRREQDVSLSITFPCEALVFY